jgi:hypothetical protein
MLKSFFLFIFSGPFLISAQRVIDVDKSDVSPLKGHFYNIAGSAVSMAKYVRVVEGSPFFSETWMKGTAFLPDGNQVENLLLRLDLVADEVHFIAESGKEMVATNPISEILLLDSLTGDKYHFVHSSAFVTVKSPEKGWYLLLVHGSAVLFKKIQKNVNETRPYASATYQQTIVTMAVYFILNNNAFTRIKKFSQLTEVLNKNNGELLQFINANKLTGKKETDYIMVVNKYNELLHDQ